MKSRRRSSWSLVSPTNGAASGTATTGRGGLTPRALAFAWWRVIVVDIRLRHVVIIIRLLLISHGERKHERLRKTTVQSPERRRKRRIAKARMKSAKRKRERKRAIRIQNAARLTFIRNQKLSYNYRKAVKIYAVITRSANQNRRKASGIASRQSTD